jgi:hypothetical protein
VMSAADLTDSIAGCPLRCGQFAIHVKLCSKAG